MEYNELVDLYDALCATSGRLEKISILADFFRKLKGKDSRFIYLIKGKVLPDYNSGEFGLSGQLMIKTLASSFGVSSDEINKMYRKIGDLGKIAEELTNNKRQKVLFSNKLSIKKVFDNLSRLVGISGKGAVEKKIQLISELFSCASGREAKYIIRTILEELRTGVADGIIRDAITEAVFNDKKSEMAELVENAYDLTNDFALVYETAIKGEKELNKIEISPGKPVKVMLAVKAESIDEGFEICGKPAVFEYKYDGFRIVISKKEKNIKLFTRRLENVTVQFPDVVKAVMENIEGNSFILDSEIVGFNPATKEYKPFEAISQRIKRKYEIERLIKELPVEVNVFDVLYYNEESVMGKSLAERRVLLEKIVKNKEMIIRVARQIVTDDIKKAEEFYKEALKFGEEGVMIKNLNAPYKQGRRVGYMAKLKPVVNELDLVIVGAEYGSGKRGGALTSYVVACKSETDFLEIGKVSSGLKEKEEKGMSYDEMTKILRPLIEKEAGNYVKIKPKVVVSVTYQNIQKSSSYSSGYALRFPRITNYRPDRGTEDIATLEDIKRVAKR